MISAIALDDEPLGLEIIQAYCQGVDFISLAKTFTKTAEAKEYLKTFPVDLLFLDINMPEISGIDFYKALNQNVMVIFTTAHPQYAVEGFELSAVDFLLKPYSLSRFLASVNKAREYYHFLHQKEGGESHIFVRSEYSLVKIPIADIRYIEGLADYIKIHMEDGKVIFTRMTMKVILSKIPQKEFVRVHRSFIIPVRKILSVRDKVIKIRGEIDIPIGVKFEADFFKTFRNT